MEINKICLPNVGDSCHVDNVSLTNKILYSPQNIVNDE